MTPLPLHHQQPGLARSLSHSPSHSHPRQLDQPTRIPAQRDALRRCCNCAASHCIALHCTALWPIAPAASLPPIQSNQLSLHVPCAVCSFLLSSPSSCLILLTLPSQQPVPFDSRLETCPQKRDKSVVSFSPFFFFRAAIALSAARLCYISAAASCRRVVRLLPFPIRPTCRAEPFPPSESRPSATRNSISSSSTRHLAPRTIIHRARSLGHLGATTTRPRTIVEGQSQAIVRLSAFPSHIVAETNLRQSERDRGLISELLHGTLTLTASAQSSYTIAPRPHPSPRSESIDTLEALAGHRA